MKTVLFVCTGNTCRSSMAEAIFKDIIKEIKGHEDVKVLSAGTWAVKGQKASENAIAALKERNVDLASHTSKSLTKQMVEEADVVLTMTRNHKMHIINVLPEAKNKVYTLKEFAYGKDVDNLDICDPYGQDIEVYKKCSYEIEESLKEIVRKYYK